MPQYRNQIIQGDALAVLRTMPDQFVHCVVTSIPYWGLRSYLPKDHPDKPLELGSEKTPAEYVEKMVEVFREVRRVLRDDGTFWLNIGDSYAGSWGDAGHRPERTGTEGQQRPKETSWLPREGMPKTAPPAAMPRKLGLKERELVGMPWLLAFALRADGWLLRRDNIWAKPSPMPESVNGVRWERHRVKVKEGKWMRRDPRRGPIAPSLHVQEPGEWADCPGCPKCEKNDGLILRRSAWRCTNAHEYVFQFVKSKMYYGDREAVKEPSEYPDDDRKARSRPDHKRMPTDQIAGIRPGSSISASRNPRDVWWINAKAYKEAHFATFPPDLVKRCVLASTSQKGYCPTCGEPWARIVSTERKATRPALDCKDDETDKANRDPERHCTESKTLGWRATCDCGIEETTPAIVLDPFIGSGTVAQVAAQLRRDYLGIELNKEYIELCSKRRLEKRRPGFI